MRTRKPKGPKRVNYKLIDPSGEAGKVMYKLLGRLVAAHHPELKPARIALAWRLGWKADVDGRVKLGQLKKASDLDRELRPFDFVVLINRGFYEDADVSDARREALLDHELCHGQRKQDTNGEDMVDERGRPVFRLRKHDLEEFSEIAERHGCWKRDLEQFAMALRRSKQASLFPESTEQIRATAPTNGNGSRVILVTEFSRALKRECQQKGWTTQLSGDGKTITIDVPASKAMVQ